MNSTLYVVAQKELREITRDGRVRVLFAIVLTLTLAALVFGAQQTYKAAQARQQAKERAQTQWESQGEKNPHVAAHYGTHVFAPTSVATAIDPGVSAYLGRSIRIEAHRRNLASHASAQEGAALQRHGGFSVALVLYLLVPLLLIALGYGMWSRERERGTLKQVLSTGIDRRTLLWGKATALFGALMALLLPAGILILGVLWWIGGGGGSVVFRLALLALCYLLYLGTFGALALYASAVATTSRTSLVTMIGLWGLFCLIIPRLGTEVAGFTMPLPSQAELSRAIASSLENGIDGKTTQDDAVEKIITALMKEQNLANAGMLMDEAELNGIELRAEARWEDQIYDHHMAEFQQQLTSQEKVGAMLGLLSPYVAIRNLSAGLCGTDLAHHQHFSAHTEQWRKSFVDYLNKAFAKDSGAEGWDYRAGPELWKKAPPFTYQEPGADFAIGNHMLSLGALLFWFALAFFLALASSRRVRV